MKQSKSFLKSIQLKDIVKHSNATGDIIACHNAFQKRLLLNTAKTLNITIIEPVLYPMMKPELSYAIYDLNSYMIHLKKRIGFVTILKEV